MATIENIPASDSGTESEDEGSNWAVKEFTKPQRAALNQSISYDDYLKLIGGFSPRDMDDRWLLTCTKLDPTTGRGAAQLYRSWTGYEDLRGDFFLLKTSEPSDSKAPYIVFDRLWWETDPERRGRQTGDEAKAIFVRLLRDLVGVITIDRDQGK